jgi:hypothetical protein
MEKVKTAEARMPEEQWVRKWRPKIVYIFGTVPA